MRKMITTVAALAVLALASPAQAANATFDIGWTTCAPTTASIDSITPGALTTTLFATAIGGDVPHKAYEFTLMYGNAGTRTYPDAWAFDATGCQTASGVTLNHLGSKTCPSFQGLLQSLQIKDVSRVPAGLGYETTFMRISLANAYPNGGAGNTTEVNPLTRYFLGSVVFSHEFSVNGPSDPGNTCGGLDEAICFATISASYVTIPGETIQFNNNGNRSVTVRTSAGCPQTPTRNATWGQIKSQYRM